MNRIGIYGYEYSCTWLICVSSYSLSPSPSLADAYTQTWCDVRFLVPCRRRYARKCVCVCDRMRICVYMTLSIRLWYLLRVALLLMLLKAVTTVNHTHTHTSTTAAHDKYSQRNDVAFTRFTNTTVLYNGIVHNVRADQYIDAQIPHEWLSAVRNRKSQNQKQVSARAFPLVPSSRHENHRRRT